MSKTYSQAVTEALRERREALMRKKYDRLEMVSYYTTTARRYPKPEDARGSVFALMSDLAQQDIDAINLELRRLDERAMEIHIEAQQLGIADIDMSTPAPTDEEHEAMIARLCEEFGYNREDSA